MVNLVAVLAIAAAPLSSLAAITLTVGDDASIAAAAKTAAQGMLTFYTGDQPGQIPGIFPQSENYYWWEAGAAWNALLDYWRYTGDTTFNSLISTAMAFQTGSDNDYLPANQSLSEGNDDQGFWGLMAMSAAEYNFPQAPGKPGWLALAQAVFNELASRWDTTNCAGGLRWQIYQFNTGWNYKNSISQGCLFHLGARLARYTGNDTYAQWAEKAFDWMESVQFLDSNYAIYDGASIPGCTDIDSIQWTYNNAMFIAGSAFMYNYTNGASKWETAVNGLLTAAKSQFFTSDGVIWEPACENLKTCNTDQLSFKGYLAAYLGYTTQMAPFTAATIVPLLQTSSVAAAQACAGGSSATMCGMQWTLPGWDGLTGVGEQMSALNVFNSNLVKNVQPPLTTTTGGTSQGNVNAGAGQGNVSAVIITPATTGDKAGAAILTVISCAASIGCLCWLVV